MTPYPKTAFLLIVFFFFSSAVPNHGVLADSLEAQFVVLSEYDSLDDAHRPFYRRWHIAVSSDGGGVQSAVFHLHKQRLQEPLCTVKIYEYNSGRTIHWYGISRRFAPIIKTENSFLVVPGYPVPCDILPSSKSDSPVTFETRDEAGGRTFVKTYVFTCREVSFNEAMHKGWLNENQKQPSNDMSVRMVCDDQGRLVVQQLWVDDEPWWRYEETPFRRSWLIDSEQ